MKIKNLLRIAILYLLVSPTVIYGQEDTLTASGDNVPYTEYMDDVMQNLDKNLVPYGILYDRVFPFAALKDTLDDEDTINTEFFIQSYSELERADYAYEPDPDMFDHTMIREFINGENRQNRIPVFAMDYLYASIDPDAVADGRIEVVDGLMYDVPNTPSPYLQHNLCVLALGVGIELEPQQLYELQFPQLYQLGNNTNVYISSVTINNLTDNTTTTFNAGDNTNISFGVSGINVLEITLTLTNSATLTYSQKVGVAVQKTTYTNCTSNVINFTTHLGFQGYDESSVAYGQGEYQIFYSYTGNCQLTKPVLILDGFDPGNSRDIHNIYTKRLVYNGGSNNFADELRAAGYDVIILNFPVYYTHTTYVTIRPPRVSLNNPGTTIATHHYRDGGADYIERNAMVMIKMLDEINIALSNNNSFDNKIVVVGPSMGGQISRYALKYMENNNWNHNTRLWISFDSPHHGANIPYGFQEMLRYLYKNQNVESAGKTYNEQLRSPAARQMLIHQADPYGPTNQPWAYQAFSNAEPFRQTWKNVLNNLGFPNNLRKVALVNGSYAGGEYHTPGTNLFTLKGRTQKTGILLTTVEPRYMNTYTDQIMRFWRIGSSYTVSAHATLPFAAIDACPGGTYDIQQEFYDQANGMVTNVPWPLGFMKTTVEDLTHDIAFIPTVSGLALYNPYFDWRNSLDVGDILCNNKTPFDNIYVPAQNEPHTSISAESVQWIKEEIFNGQNPCTKICGPYLLGDGGLVVNGTETYYLYNAPSGMPVYWSVTPGLQILSFSSTSVDVRRISSGVDKVTAHIDNSCGADAYPAKTVYTYSPKIGKHDDTSAGYNSSPIGSIQEQEGAQIVHIYPNPASEVWNISVQNYTSGRAYLASLFDIRGKKINVYQSDDQGNLKIDNHELGSGVYFLKINSGTEIKTYKLLK